MKRQRPSIKTILDPDERLRLRALEQVLTDYETEKQLHKGRLPRGAHAGYMERLKDITGSTSPETLRSLLVRYQTYREDYPNDDPINSLINIPGRPTVAISDAVKEFIIKAYIRRERKSRSAVGGVYTITSAPTVEEVYKLTRRRYPELQIGLRRIYKILADAKNTNPARFEYLRTDAPNQSLTRNLGSKKLIFYANQFWMLDIRPLPQKLRGDGFDYSVDLIALIEPSSGVYLAFALIPRKYVTHDGKIMKTTARQEDIYAVISYAINAWGWLPDVGIYTDLGSQMLNIAERMQLLFKQASFTPEVIHTLAEMARGKGKVEKLQGLLDRIVAQLPGDPRTDRPFPKKVTKKDRTNLASLEHYRAEVKEFIDRHNNEPIDGYASRIEKYRAESVGHRRPAPSLLDLAMFCGMQKLNPAATVYIDGIQYEGVRWQNYWQSSEDYERFNRIVRTKVPIAQIPLAHGIRVIARFDDTWIEVFPNEVNSSSSAATYAGFQRRAKQALATTRKRLIQEFEGELVDVFGEIPAVDVHSREPVLRPDHAGTTDASPDGMRKPNHRRAGKAPPTITTLNHAAPQPSAHDSAVERQPPEPSSDAPPIPPFIARLQELKRTRDTE